jgi:adenylyl- and sulfurtransferase ThiI
VQQLKEYIATETPKGVSVAKTSRKRKRNAYDTPEEILYEIQKDQKYAQISMASKESMRKWFTILLRRKMVSIAQMPRNEQGKKAFVDAMIDFKLLEN